MKLPCGYLPQLMDMISFWILFISSQIVKLLWGCLRQPLLEMITRFTHLISSQVMKPPPPWPDLPRLPIDMILDRLTITDHVRFSSVCTSWRNAARDHRPHHASSPHRVPQMPWLMFSHDPKYPEQRYFYSLSERRYYHVSLPAEVQGKHCCGAAHGWLLFLKDFMSRFYTSVVLVNPIAPLSEIEIPLPPSKLLPLECPFGVLSAVPTDPDCVILLSTNYEHLFRRVRGDKYWITLHHIPQPYGLLPAVCGGKFYIRSRPSDGSKLIVVGLFPDREVRFLDMRLVGLPVSPLHRQEEYLVESDGQILMVCLTKKPHEELVERFDVFEADLSRKVWVRMESLGNRVLFLSDYQHLSLSSAETGGPGNRIYFTTLDVDYLNYLVSTIWIEYDYGSHRIVSSKLPDSMDGNMSSRNNILLCIVPSLC